MTLSVLDKHIEATPGVCGGKPRIAGHRITVHNVALWQGRVGMTPEEIASEYDLGLADVYAALAYYHDHKEQIDRETEEGEAYAEAMRETAPSVLDEALSEEQRATLEADVDRKVSAWETGGASER